jgi:hypothetical protein
MRSAEQLLRDTNLSAKEIAYRVGFAGYQGFLKAYRRMYGDTPVSMTGVFGAVVNSPFSEPVERRCHDADRTAFVRSTCVVSYYRVMGNDSVSSHSSVRRRQK